jgi:hypothetical protein
MLRPLLVDGKTCVIARFAADGWQELRSHGASHGKLCHWRRDARQEEYDVSRKEDRCKTRARDGTSPARQRCQEERT